MVYYKYNETIVMKSNLKYCLIYSITMIIHLNYCYKVQTIYIFDIYYGKMFSFSNNLPFWSNFQKWITLNLSILGDTQCVLHTVWIYLKKSLFIKICALCHNFRLPNLQINILKNVELRESDQTHQSFLLELSHYWCMGTCHNPDEL